MPYSPSKGVYEYIDEQIAFPNQTTGHRAKMPLPRWDIIGEAQRQAEQRQRNLLNNTRSPTEGLPRVRNAPRQYQGNVEEEYEDDQFQTRVPTVTRRYDTGSDGLPVQGRRTRVEEYYHSTPFISRRGQAKRPADATPEYQRRGRVKIHWLAFVGIGVIIALTLWIGAAYFNAWWTSTQNDWTYTRDFRTFSINKAVGHDGDNNARPSHFIVQNDNRHIIIIELPANDASKSIIYSGPFLVGDGEEKTPVTISFVENVETGRLDMVLHVEDQSYIFKNDGTKFVTPPAGG